MRERVDSTKLFTFINRFINREKNIVADQSQNVLKKLVR